MNTYWELIEQHELEKQAKLGKGLQTILKGKALFSPTASQQMRGLAHTHGREAAKLMAKGEKKKGIRMALKGKRAKGISGELGFQKQAYSLESTREHNYLATHKDASNIDAFYANKTSTMAQRNAKRMSTPRLQKVIADMEYSKSIGKPTAKIAPRNKKAKGINPKDSKAYNRYIDALKLELKHRQHGMSKTAGEAATAYKVLKPKVLEILNARNFADADRIARSIPVFSKKLEKVTRGKKDKLISKWKTDVGNTMEKSVSGNTENLAEHYLNRRFRIFDDI